MTKAYSYIRMSTKEQLKGNSALRQFEKTKAYAEANGLELQDIINDIGVSAFKGANAKFGKLAIFLAGIENGKIERGSYLIIESLDRLSRSNLLDALNLLMGIVSKGIVVVTISDGQTYTRENFEAGPTQLIIALTVMMRAHEESDIKSQRMSSAWSKKRTDIQSGKVTSQRIPAWLKFTDDKTALKPISDRVKLLKEIFAMSRDGNGAYSIARKLNGRKEAPWGRSKIWHESYIKKILNSRAVLGEFQPKKLHYEDDKKRKILDGDPVLNYYPSVIDPQLFAASQVSISRRKLNGAGRKGKGNSNVFTGLIKCGVCGSGYRYLDKGSAPKGGKYLRCSESHLNGACNAAAWRYKNIEMAIVEAIEQIDFDAIINDTANVSKLAELNAKVEITSSELETIQSEIDNFLKFIASGEIESLSLRQALDKAETRQQEKTIELDSVKKEIRDLERFQPDNIRQAKTEILKLLNSKNQDPDDDRVKRKLFAELRLVLSHITLQPHHVELWELVNEKPDWFKSFNLSFAEFERRCSRFAFKLELQYHNGDTHIFSPIDWEKIRLDSSPEMNIFLKKKALPSE